LVTIETGLLGSLVDSGSEVTSALARLALVG
jgi:hypothetical protein